MKTAKARFDQTIFGDWYIKGQPIYVGTPSDRQALVNTRRAYWEETATADVNRIEFDDLPKHEELRNAGFKTVADVLNATDEQLLSIHGIGKKTLEEIRDC